MKKKHVVVLAVTIPIFLLVSIVAITINQITARYYNGTISSADARSKGVFVHDVELEADEVSYKDMWVTLEAWVEKGHSLEHRLGLIPYYKPFGGNRLCVLAHHSEKRDFTPPVPQLEESKEPHVRPSQLILNGPDYIMARCAVPRNSISSLRIRLSAFHHTKADPDAIFLTLAVRKAE